MTARALTLALLAVGSASGAAAQETEERPPFELLQPQPGDGPLSMYGRLLDAEPTHPAGSQAGDFIHQILAQEAGSVGDSEAALRWNDATLSATRWDSVGVVPDGAQAVDAVAEIARRAEGTQVVMINEAHYDASTRLLTLALLEPLYARGYRYFAAETFQPDSVLSTVRYPSAQMGTYTKEPVFGAVVREALRLGYTLVPYEIEQADQVEGDTMSTQRRRDLTEARHLLDRTIGRDPDAKVLVHAGYAHVNEARVTWFYPMAEYFRRLSGLDPLTVEQTELGPTSEQAYEHPRYRAAVAAGLVGNRPVVLLGADGDALAPVGEGWSTDLQVLRPCLAGRPVEALGYGQLRPLDLPPECGPCVVEVRRMDEGSDAVPVDRLAVFEGGTVDLHSPRDMPLIVTTVDGRTGRLLDRRLALAQ